MAGNCSLLTQSGRLKASLYSRLGEKARYGRSRGEARLGKKGLDLEEKSSKLMDFSDLIDRHSVFLPGDAFILFLFIR